MLAELDFSNKSVVITGASRGIGFGVAEAELTANLVADALEAHNQPEQLQAVRARVAQLTAAFPVYRAPHEVPVLRTA